MVVYICTKLHENILNGIRVMERTRKVNGRTDGWRARHNTTRLRRAYKMIEQEMKDKTMSAPVPLDPTKCFEVKNQIRLGRN